MSEKAADSGTRYSREQIHFQWSFQKCAIWLHLSRFRCWSSRAAHFGRKMNWRSTLHILFLQGREFDGQSGQKRIFITIWQFKSSQMRNFHKMVLFSLATATATGIIDSKSCCHFLNLIFSLWETAQKPILTPRTCLSCCCRVSDFEDIYRIYGACELVIGPRCPWSDLCVRMSVRPSVREVVKLNWCDSGWWGYQLNTNW